MTSTDVNWSKGIREAVDLTVPVLPLILVFGVLVLGLNPTLTETVFFWVSSRVERPLSSSTWVLMQRVVWVALRLVAILLFVVLVYANGWNSTFRLPGFQRMPPKRLFGVGAMLGVFALYGFPTILCYCASSVEVSDLSNTSGFLLLLVAYFSTCVIAPVSEEILFRGWLQRLVTPACGKWIAVPIQALIFGLVHFRDPGGFYTVLIASGVGCWLGFVYLQTGKLWVCMILHSVTNLLWGWYEPWWIWSKLSGNS